MAMRMEINTYLASLCHGTGHDGGGSSGEGELEEPSDVVPATRGVHQEEVRAADEPLLV